MTNHNMNKECRISKIGTGSPNVMKKIEVALKVKYDYLIEMSKQKTI